MKAVFVETTEFTEWISKHLTDDVYCQLQQELMDNPEKGNVIPTCGGLRKVRIANPKRNKGKRGGARVIYLYVPKAKWFFMLDIYGKDEQDDLTPSEKKELSNLVVELKRHAISVASSPKRKPK